MEFRILLGEGRRINLLLSKLRIPNLWNQFLRLRKRYSAINREIRCQLIKKSILIVMTSKLLRKCTLSRQKTPATLTSNCPMLCIRWPQVQNNRKQTRELTVKFTLRLAHWRLINLCSYKTSRFLKCCRTFKITILQNLQPLIKTVCCHRYSSSLKVLTDRW